MKEFRTSDRSEIWINGGYFIFRREIFDYLKEGEELVLEPFTRLIAEGQLMAYKHQRLLAFDGYAARPADPRGHGRTGQHALARQFGHRSNAGVPPARRAPGAQEADGMKTLPLVEPGARFSVLCLGAHSDDIEIGVGGTILGWIAAGVKLDVCWCVLSAQGPRRQEAMAAAETILEGAASRRIELAEFRDGYFPYQGDEIKSWIENIKTLCNPDIVFTHRKDDAHQDHREISRLTWNAFRDHLVLEYEIPKWDGDLGQPNVYVAMSEEIFARKSKLLETCFASQRSKDWFDADTFRGLARLRGMECRAPDRFAEAFLARKIRVA